MSILTAIVCVSLLCGCITDDAESGRTMRHDNQLVVRLAHNKSHDRMFEEKFAVLFEKYLTAYIMAHWKEILIALAVMERVGKEYRDRKKVVKHDANPGL